MRSLRLLSEAALALACTVEEIASNIDWTLRSNTNAFDPNSNALIERFDQMLLFERF